MDTTPEKRKAALGRPSHNALISMTKFGAGEGIRTLDPNLGKVMTKLRHGIRQRASVRYLSEIMIII
ncbi:hypothetical protein C5688_18655 [Methylocystis sp. MitZ-2018]|nr:hypothetical protein C5688_18655 [Methylocystis sp. MitZ-2018]